MAKKREAVTAQRTRRVDYIPGIEAPDLYANSANIEVSTFDTKIRLGLVAAADNERVLVRDIAHVYMSKEHFLAFAKSVKAVAEKLGAGTIGQPYAPPKER